MSKRSAEEIYIDDQISGKIPKGESVKKHTLDSDEDDSGDDERYNVLNEDDIEGEEDGISGIDGEVKITPFNMKEELEEGHFDREGHFQWDKNKEIRDNWLDNIDWIKVKTDKKYIEKTNIGLADSSSDSEDESSKKFNELETYTRLLEHMKPGENVQKALQRLGSKTLKISSAERFRRKKAGIVDENAELVTKFTELANDLLTNLGNMDVYQETYEVIQQKINRKVKKGISIATATSTGVVNDVDNLDMYADDFDTKEKTKLCVVNVAEVDEDLDEADKKPELMWEFKWKQEDNAEIHGPFSTEQMQNWVEEGYFKEGVFVRKVGEDTKFYTSSRIDFDLYL